MCSIIAFTVSERHQSIIMYIQKTASAFVEWQHEKRSHGCFCVKSSFVGGMKLLKESFWRSQVQG